MHPSTQPDQNPARASAVAIPDTVPTRALPVFEAMATSRATRAFISDPVDFDLLAAVVWAGTRASNPANAQPWDFVVVVDPEIKARIAAAIQSAYPPRSPDQLPRDPELRRTSAGADALIASLAGVPALIFACARPYPSSDAPVPEFMHSAIFAASQNMLVAAHGIGLGAAFTTLHRGAEAVIETVIGLPADRTIMVTMPVGWPSKPTGAVSRRPLSEVVHRDTW